MIKETYIVLEERFEEIKQKVKTIFYFNLDVYTGNISLVKKIVFVSYEAQPDPNVFSDYQRSREQSWVLGLGGKEPEVPEKVIVEAKKKFLKINKKLFLALKEGNFILFPFKEWERISTDLRDCFRVRLDERTIFFEFEKNGMSFFSTSHKPPKDILLECAEQIYLAVLQERIKFLEKMYENL